MNACPVCDASEVTRFLTREQTPVHQNLLVGTQDDAHTVTRGDLRMVVCDACGFVFNEAFDPALLEYGKDYDNTQRHSPFFGEYMEELGRYLLNEEGVRGMRVVEVGCGKGDFLRLLVGDPEVGNTGHGFDPSYVGPDVELDGRLRFDRYFYDATCAGIPADVVISRHVIEHTPRPLDMLRAIRQALSGAGRPRVYFETPCVQWILAGQVVWDVFYEHCSLFSPASARTAFERVGFVVRRIRHVFGGQYLWIEAEVGEDGAEVSYEPGELPALAARFGNAERRLWDRLIGQITALKAEGKVALWGAGAKGTTCANVVDPTRELIDCVVDINPNKQGRFVPGTGHPIVDPSALATRDVTSAILMNPNYRKEILRSLRERGIKTRLVDSAL